MADELAGLGAAGTGGVSTGLLNSDVGGRTDNLPVNVPNGSYVVPADVVSGLGEGNTFAGTKILTSMFKDGPMGMKLKKVGSGKRPGSPRGVKRPWRPRFADGGEVDEPMAADPAAIEGLGFAGALPPPGLSPEQQFVDEPAVPIEAAGGEYILTPEEVENIGGGSIEHGHQILDAFVKKVRGDTIDTMKKLPGPAKA